MMSTNQLLILIDYKLNTGYSYLNVFKYICKQLNINYIAAMKKNRKKEFVESRYIFFYVIRLNTNDCFQIIGDFLNTDHSTVLHGIKMINELYKEKKIYNEHTKKIKSIIEQTEKQFFNKTCFIT